MSEYTHPVYKKTARIMTVVCGLLFFSFSFVYLYVFQKDVLEAYHYTLAHGKTHYVAQNAALIITIVLLLLRWGVNCLLGLKGAVRSLSYFPSCLLLGALTDISCSVYHTADNSGWQWWVPVTLLVFVGAAFGLRRLFRTQLDKEIPLMQLVNGNLLILFLLCLMTVMIGNQNTSFHHELAVERCIRNGDYSQAARIGEKSLQTTRTLNVLRAYALSLEGRMGDRLFYYPQPYGVQGLLFDAGSTETQRITADSLYHYLGDRPAVGEDLTGFLRNSCRQERGTHATLDYYMSALLLDKNLDEFSTAVAEYYAPEDTLPVHYREALLLYQAEHPAYEKQHTDSLMQNALEQYNTLRAGYTDAVEQKNQMRRTHGHTYWWYYHYQ